MEGKQQEDIISKDLRRAFAHQRQGVVTGGRIVLGGDAGKGHSPPPTSKRSENTSVLPQHRLRKANQEATATASNAHDRKSLALV